jgi:tetratricopeptide (TPR) repeat protein
LVALRCSVFLFGVIAVAGELGTSLLGIYALPLDTTSVEGDIVTFGPLPDLEFQVTIANEEGDFVLFFPEGYVSALAVELHRDGEAVTSRDLSVKWRQSLEVLDLEGTQPSQQVIDIHQLEPGFAVRSFLQLEHADGRPFSYGSYRVLVEVEPNLVRMRDDEPWAGRGGKGGAVFEIRRIEGERDEITRYVVLASRATRAGNLDLAERYYSKIAEITPDDPSSYTGLGLTLLRKGEYKRAIPFLEEALEDVRKTRARSSVPSALAYCYVATEQEGKALELLAEFGPPDRAVERVEQMQESLAQAASQSQEQD